MVAHAPRAHGGLGDVRLDGKQFDRGHPETDEMTDDGGFRETQIRSAVLRRHVGVPCGKRSHVKFVDNGFLPRPFDPRSARAGVVGRHHRQRGVAQAVDARRPAERVAVVGDECVVVAEFARDAGRPRIQKQLGGVEAHAACGVPASVRAVAVALSRTDPLDDAVPDAVRPLDQVDPRLVAVLGNQAHLYQFGVGSVDRELRSGATHIRSQGKR